MQLLGALLLNFALELIDALRFLQGCHFANALFEGFLFVAPGLFVSGLQLLAQRLGQL
ncbi:hypothetical protein D3C85_1928310 [compost metagenome]